MTSDNTKFPDTQHIGVLVFDDFEPIDVWGFVQAFAIARFIGTCYADNEPRPFKISLISNEKSGDGKKTPTPVRSYNGPSVAPDYFLDQALEEPFRLLMIPGGFGLNSMLYPGANDPNPREELITWLKDMRDNWKEKLLITSVCTGAALLAAAGILDGKPAATNHQAFASVTRQGPNVLWDNVSRWVDAGDVVTSAGVSAGTDMGFYLVSRLAGRAVAEAAALAAEYDWHRDPQHPIYYPPQARVPSTRQGG